MTQDKQVQEYLRDLEDELPAMQLAKLQDVLKHRQRDAEDKA